MKYNRSLKNKIFSGLVLVNLGFIFIVNFILQAYTKDIAEAESNGRMNTSILAYQRFLEQKRLLLTNMASSVAHIPFLKATLSIPEYDQETLDFAVKQVKEASTIPTLILLDSNGQVIASSDNLDKNLSMELNIENSDNLISEGTSFRNIIFNGQPYHAGFSSVMAGPELLGMVVIAQVMNSKEEQALAHDVTGSSFITTYGETITDTHFTDEEITLLSRIYETKTDTLSTILQDQKTKGETHQLMINHFNYIVYISPHIGISGHSILYKRVDLLPTKVQPLILVIAITSAFTLIVSLIAGFWFARKITNPVIELMNATKSYADGQFDTRVDVQSNDEIAQLGLSFNEMAEELNHRRSQLISKEAAEAEMRQLAYFDALTGLPNRRYFLEHLKFLMKLQEIGAIQMGVFFIDVDNFKQINDTLGHDIGDELLKHVAEGLNKCVENTGIISRAGHQSDLLTEQYVSRLGGDEFTIVIAHSVCTIESACKEIANRILNHFQHPFMLSGHEVSIGTSIGIAIGSTDCKNSEELLKNADSAMYQTKLNGKHNYTIYDINMNEDNRHL